MKADPEIEQNAIGDDNQEPISGDVIGDTAYSERFVLKILLKLANRDTLAHEIKEPAFEEELCTLWDMTAERDVVLYLQRHSALNLFTFAMPVIDTPRIIEIIIGTIANMCCHKEAVDSLLTNKDLLGLLLDFLKSDDSQILNQLLRLISSCLYVADDDDISIWLDMFKNVGYADTLYFILKNSTNKELLMTAFENLNTICLNCQIEGRCSKFNEMFLTDDAPAAVYAGHCEYCSQACQEEKLERLHVITLQMVLHLTRITRANDDQHNNGAEVLTNFDNSESAIYLLRDILVSYESRITEYYKIDLDFLDVLDAATVFIQFLELSELCSADKYFTPCYNMWKALIPNGRERDSGELKAFFDDIKEALSVIMATYMAQCTDENLLTLLHGIGDDYGNIVSQISDAEMQVKIANRALSYRSRINDKIDS